MNGASILARLVVTCVALGGLCAAAPGQALHVDSKLGFQFKPPKDYKSVAIDPLEERLVAKYQAPTPEGSGDAGGVSFYRILQLQFFARGGFAAMASETDEDAPQTLNQQLRGFLDRLYDDYELTDERQLSIAGTKASELKYTSKDKPLSRYCLLIEQEEGIFLFEGTSLTQRFKDASAVFAKSAKTFKRVEKADRVERDAELAQMSEQDRFLQQQIEKLPPGWSSLRTPRYLFLYNAEKSFVQQMADQIECMRNEYERLYPPDKPLTAVSIVRVCNSFEEFSAYSGMPPGVGGYWAWQMQELVFYDKRPRDETLCVLRHEAFHQYIFYFYGQLSPHSWYNEGQGDYFSGAELTKTNRITNYGKAPGGYNRAELVKEMARKTGQGMSVSEGALAPLKELMQFHQPEYYDHKGGSLPVAYYPEGWAAVHMLREAKGLQSKWQRILPDYLQNLVAARHQIATELMEKAVKKYEKAKAAFDAGDEDAPEEQPKDPPREPKDYYIQASEDKKDDVQDLAYKKTFSDWTDTDWKEFQDFFLKYVEKL